MSKRVIGISAIMLLMAFLVIGCASAPKGPRMVDTYVFDDGVTSSKTVDGVTVSAQYVATDNWDWILNNPDFNKMLAVPHEDFNQHVIDDGLEKFIVYGYSFQNGDNNYYFPVVANMNAFLITIKNDTKGVIKVKDLRVGFLTSDGERYNNMNKNDAADWMLDAVRKEKKVQLDSFSANWVPLMNMYCGAILLEGKINRKFKIINDADAEIYPGETFKGFALFDGGVEFDSKKNTVTFLETAKLGVYEVPVQVDEVNNVTKRGEFIFDIKRAKVDATASSVTISE